ncbi:MAG: ParBc, ParB-like nuclease domain [Firmicutes bacterium]|nr:ParBc, ParB-like nuclease domain [Bacillota bacterium]
MTKKGLGRGLGALIPEMEVPEQEGEHIQDIEVSAIVGNAKQPRKAFDQVKLDELASSIREHGVVQPIVVRPKGTGYEIVAGERRWRAAKQAGLSKIPALVREFSEAQVMEIALIENLQRQDLNPVEEAEAYHLLMDEFQLTQDDLAKRLGKSRPQIANTLRLLQLSPVARAEVESGRLTMGHAKVLLGVPSEDEQSTLATRIAEEGLSVREIEDVIRRSAANPSGRNSKRAEVGLTSDLRAVERQLNELFGTPVKLVVGEQKGKIEITFFGNEGLGRILDALGMSEEHSATPAKGAFRV